MKNVLSQETSPYLLQHANNPVFWQPWNTAVLEKAVAENLLLIVSIGYSACHWCHVMEHESFENEQVAAVMNHGFVNIKIDREERPDIDAVYMKAIQIMTGQGGWPLNVVCLPDGRPVWGGTYFKKEHWTETLTELRKMYATEPQKMIDYAEKLHNGIKEISIIESPKNDTNFDFDTEIVKNLVAKWSKSFDLDFGGMARTPKFMMPNNYEFLLQYAHQYNDKKVMDFVNLTLTKMAFGGLFDTVDGGFSRYSVDGKWHVPHFEKMGYDNGQLLSLYANAFKKTKNKLYQTVVEKTIGFINRELLDASGGFYCALDADSVNAFGTLEEGAFYVWTKLDLERLIGADFELFSEVYNINDFGFWEHGNYVLIQNDSLKNIAKTNHISEVLLASKKQQWENILFHEREKRPKPRLDDKCLTSWNAILCLGFVDCYKAFGETAYLETAVKNGQFIKQKMLSEDGCLFRNFKNNKVTIKAFLEDYAHVISCFIGLYQVTLEQNWIIDAKQLTDYCLVHFWDSESGFFAFNDNSETTFLAKHFETEDNVISASNSVMAKNLLYLNIIFENTHYEKTALNMLQHIVPNIDYPSAYANWLSVYCSLSQSQKELAILGENALDCVTKINATYLPNVCLVASESASEIPFLKDKLLTNQTTFYLCKNKTCGLPTSDFGFVLDEIIKN